MKILVLNIQEFILQDDFSPISRLQINSDGGLIYSRCDINVGILYVTAVVTDNL